MSKNIYKEETVEAAIAAGLADLGLTEEDVEIEIISEGGRLKKASVAITVKGVEAEDFDEEDDEDENEGEKEEVEESEKASIIEGIKEKSFGFVKGLIELMGVDCETDVEVEENIINISISGPESRIIIGRRGEVLDAIQHIAMTAVNKEKRIDFKVVVDAENYRKRRVETLKRVAENNARKAVKYREIVELEPMNAYERRVIHTTLAGRKDVTTRSEGEGRDRHVEIIPCDDEGNEIGEKREKSRYGTSHDFRRKGTGKMKSFGQPRRMF
jgi:spoIIIJ-associated protein